MELKNYTWLLVIAVFFICGYRVTFDHDPSGTETIHESAIKELDPLYPQFKHMEARVALRAKRLKAIYLIYVNPDQRAIASGLDYIALMKYTNICFKKWYANEGILCAVNPYKRDVAAIRKLARAKPQDPMWWGGIIIEVAVSETTTKNWVICNIDLKVFDDDCAPGMAFADQPLIYTGSSLAMCPIKDLDRNVRKVIGELVRMSSVKILALRK